MNYLVRNTLVQINVSTPGKVSRVVSLLSVFSSTHSVGKALCVFSQQGFAFFLSSLLSLLATCQSLWPSFIQLHFVSATEVLVPHSNQRRGAGGHGRGDAQGFDGAHLCGYAIRVMLRPLLAHLISRRTALQITLCCPYFFVVFLRLMPVCY